MPELKKLTKKQLEKEYNDNVQQIAEGSFGTRDLRYQDELGEEICRRGYDLVSSPASYKLV